MGNPLVEQPVDTTTPFSGAGVLGDGEALCTAIGSGDWVSGGIAAFSFAFDTAATLSDPIGSLIGAGLGWLIDHVEPIKGWFDDLTGDPAEVTAFSATWTNVATQLDASAQDLRRIVASDMQTQLGEAMDAYRRFQEDAAQHLGGAAQWASGMATGLKVAGVIVQLVHDLVRDVLSQLVGSIISWVAEEVFSLGLATPWVIEQVSTRVASLAETVGTKVTALLDSLGKLGALLKQLKGLWDRFAHLVDTILLRDKKADVQQWVRDVLGRGGDEVPTPRSAAPDLPEPAASPTFDADDPDTWPFDLTDPEQVYAHAFHNVDADHVVLGRFYTPDDPETYSVIARQQGAMYFELPTTGDGVDLWDAVSRANGGLSDSDMFETVNTAFLDDVIAQGKPVEFTYDPLDPGRSQSALRAEYDYLEASGRYTWDPSQGLAGTWVPK